MREGIKITPLFILINVLVGCIGFNIGTFVAKQMFNQFGIIVGILFGWVVGWVVSAVVIVLILFLLKFFGGKSNIPQEMWDLLGISTSWSVFWAVMPAIVKNSTIADQLISIFTLLTILSFLQWISLYVFSRTTIKKVLWGNLTGALVFLLAVFLMAFLRLSNQGILTYLSWGVFIGLGSTLMLRQDMRTL